MTDEPSDAELEAGYNIELVEEMIDDKKFNSYFDELIRIRQKLILTNKVTLLVKDRIRVIQKITK